MLIKKEDDRKNIGIQNVLFFIVLLISFRNINTQRLSYIHSLHAPLLQWSVFVTLFSWWYDALLFFFSFVTVFFYRHYDDDDVRSSIRRRWRPDRTLQH